MTIAKLRPLPDTAGNRGPVRNDWKRTRSWGLVSDDGGLAVDCRGYALDTFLPVSLRRAVAETGNVNDRRGAQLERAVQQAANQYFRLVILAGPPASGKTATLLSIAQKHGLPLVNVNLELSKRMLELTRSQRSRQTERLLKEVIAVTPGEVVLLDNLEILFDTGLEIEPLRLLQVSSRNRTIVASWSGSFHGGTLTYAEPGHPEFIQFKKTEAVVIAVGTSVNN